MSRGHVVTTDFFSTTVNDPPFRHSFPAPGGLTQETLGIPVGGGEEFSIHWDVVPNAGNPTFTIRYKTLVRSQGQSSDGLTTLRDEVWTDSWVDIIVAQASPDKGYIVFHPPVTEAVKFQVEFRPLLIRSKEASLARVLCFFPPHAWCP